MKPYTLLIPLFALLFLLACGGGQNRIEQIKQQSTVAEADPYTTWESNHGVGPVKAFELPPEIDQSLAATGQEIYEAKCTACHRIDKRFIGPAPVGILEKRTPAWIMNMILDPEGMVKQDPIAKKLLMEFNGSPMANQNLTQEDARAVLEYFRTLK